MIFDDESILIKADYPLPLHLGQITLKREEGQLHIGGGNRHQKRERGSSSLRGDPSSAGSLEDYRAFVTDDTGGVGMPSLRGGGGSSGRAPGGSVGARRVWPGARGLKDPTMELVSCHILYILLLFSVGGPKL